MPSILTNDGFEIILQWNDATDLFEIEIRDDEADEIIWWGSARTVSKLDHSIGELGFYINDSMREEVELQQAESIEYNELFLLYANEHWQLEE